MNSADSSNWILKVKNLRLAFLNASGRTEVLKDVQFKIVKGRSMALLGDSGSGKSVTVLGMLDLLPEYVNKELSGEVLFKSGSETVDLLNIQKKELDKIRGAKIAMIFQDPVNALNPIQKCGRQILESVLLHQGMKRKAGKIKTYELLDQVGLQEKERIYNSFPHELSGGQLQRILIAMALAGEPELLIADEPTTNLDEESKESILILLEELRNSMDLTMLYITHDLVEAQRMSDDIWMLEEGTLMKPNSTAFLNIDHFTTKGKKEKQHIEEGSLIEINKLSKSFRRRSLFALKASYTHVFSKLSFNIPVNSITGVVGRSGSGKTTLGRVLLNLEKPDDGEVVFDGYNIFDIDASKERYLRQKLQIVYQNPYNTLNPRMKVRDIVKEPLLVHGIGTGKKERKEQAEAMLIRVGIKKEKHENFMYQLSGGQRQRVAIARSLVLNPQFLVLDECISSLDKNTQLKILDLLITLKNEFLLSYFFISHDIKTVKAISDRVFKLEEGNFEQIF